MSTALQLFDVTVTYSDGDSQVTALDSVSITVAPSEFVAVVGPSGSGKSTVLAVAGALTTPATGKVTVAGEEVTGLDDAALAKVRREHIGFVFQSSGSLPSALSAEQQLELAARVADGWGRHTGAELLEKVGMTHRRRTARAASPAASASASVSPAPWSATRRSCSSTSRPPRSTATAPRRSWPFWPRSATTSTSPA